MAHPRSCRILTLAVLIFFLFIQPVAAQTERLVFNATVVNENKRPLPTFEAGDFTVFVDNEPQKLVSFNHGNVPASVGILVDTSGSADAIDKVLQHIAAGIDRLVQVGNPQNEYFIATFNSKPRMLQEWTNDSLSIRNKLLPVPLKGVTALFDGIFSGIQYVQSGNHNKKVIIVVSDGYDTNSKKSFNEVRDFLKQFDVALFAVVIVNNDSGIGFEGEEGKSVLGKLCKVTGGQALVVENGPNKKTISEAFEQIGTEIRSQYQLVIEPPQSTGIRKWHKISITAAYTDAGKRKEIKVRTREGFYR